MSVRFFYDFNEELVKKLTEHFDGEIEAMQFERNQIEQLDNVEKTIRDYFNHIVDQMTEVIKATEGKIYFEQDDEVIGKLGIMNNYLKFTRKNRSIEVKIGYYVPEADLIESIVLSYVVPGIKKAKIKRVGKIHDGSNFDENALNYYMREAFAKLDIFKG